MCDDSPQQIQRNTAVALKYGMTILGVYTDGASLIAAVKAKTQKQPQVYLLDIAMMGMTGVQVTQSLRQMNTTGKIILVTSMGQKEVSSPKAVGADYLLIKPFPDEWFLQAVTSVLANEAPPDGVENPSTAVLPLAAGQDEVT